jgi:hypothetical protein
MAFTTGSSWQWQMGMDHSDMTFELFWKQILRWLVNSSPEPVMISTDKDTYLPGETVNLVAEVSDKGFARLNNARVVARMTDAAGNMEMIPLEWSGAQEGVYKARVNGGAEGVYELSVEAAQDGTTIGTYRTAFQVHDRPVEFSNAAVDTRRLEAIASQTGGKYYPLSRLGDVPDDAVYVEGESSFVEQKELWDLPILFFLLCTSLGAEWFWRKKKGLA